MTVENNITEDQFIDHVGLNADALNVAVNAKGTTMKW